MQLSSRQHLRMASLHLMVFMFLFLTSCKTKAVPIPAGNGSNLPVQEVQNEVEQLDQLRRESQQKSGVAVVKSETAEMITVNGKQQGKQQKQEIVKDLGNNQLLATVKQSVSLSKESPADGPHTYSKTEVDIPPLGVHRVQLEKDGQLEEVGLRNKDKTPEKKNYIGWQFQPLDRPRTEDYYTKFAGIQYTPLDLAEYIFRTGDEEGVALAIEELLREGMMSREEAIAYLQDVKTELSFMKNQFDRERRFQESTQDNADSKQQNSEAKGMEVDSTLKGPEPGVASSSKTSKDVTPSSPSPTPSPTTASTSAPQSPSEPKPTSAATSAPLQAAAAALKPMEPSQASPSSSLEKKSSSHLLDYPRDLRLPPAAPVPPEYPQDEIDVAAILERLKAASSFYEEYTLEEIIYQLAKDMFTQSVLRGDQSAEEALTKFGNFLEAEVANRRISRDLEQKILDIMSAALVDSLKEFPGVLPVEQTYPGNDPSTLFQQLSLGKAQKINTDYSANIERQRAEELRNEAERRLMLPKLMQHKKSSGGNDHMAVSGQQSNQSTSRQQS